MTVRLLPVLVLLAAGCQYDEGIIVQDMHGTIVIPAEAATRTFLHEDGTEETITDPRNIGPVYLGVYPEVVEGQERYPSPKQGPVFQQGLPGDTYPYGGTSIGDIRFPCIEFLRCKVASGRFVDFDQMVTWFNETLETPIVDAFGEQVLAGDYIAGTCFDQLEYVSEEEIRLTATKDKNEDGELNELDLDFVFDEAQNAYVGEFTLWQQEYFASEDGETGFTLWGWMDAPAEASGAFATCDPNDGFQLVDYNRSFYGGRPYRDLLNLPTRYISSGDWVATPYVYASADDEPTIEINIPVEGN